MTTDSFTAFQLLETLDRLAKRGRTIILSLHQPRSDAFALFSRILLMSHGSVVYSGSTSGCLPHFAQLGFQPQERTNPLDFLIDISSIDTRDEDNERESRERVARLVQCWKEKEVMDVEKDVQGSPLSFETANATPDLEKQVSQAVPATTNGKRPNVLQQAVILVPRASRNMIRGYPELTGHILQAVILGLLMGITFFQLGGQPNDIQSLKTLTFQVVPVYGYMTQVVWTFKWCTSLVVFDREREDSLYSPAAWVLSELIAWLPMNVFAPTIYSIMVYFICNMRMDDLHYNFGVFVIDMIMIQLCLVAWSLFAASIEVRSAHSFDSGLLTMSYSVASHEHRYSAMPSPSSSSFRQATSSLMSRGGFAGSAGSPRTSSPSASSSSPSSGTVRSAAKASRGPH